jgi:hypothetical protein
MSWDYPEPPTTEPGPALELEIQVKSFDTSHVYGDVIDAIVARLIGRYNDNALTKQITDAVQSRVLARIDAIAGDVVQDLLTKPIQKHDTFGKPIGDPISVEDIVRNGAEKLLTEMVDSEGRVSRDSYGMKHTRLEWLVQKHVVSGLTKELEPYAKAARAAVTQRATEAAAAVIAGVKA